MREASYGFPPNDPDKVVWLNLRQFAALQGVDPESWTVKPYCPHCKIVMELQNAKGTQDVHLKSQPREERPEEIRDLSRAVDGFKHPRNKALKDCPYSYANDPRYAYPEGRHTAEREKQKNRKFFSAPAMTESMQEALRSLIQPVLKSDTIPKAVQRQLDRLGRMKVDGTQGLAEHYWLRPFMQVMLFGVYRPAKETPAVPPLMMEESTLFAEAAAQVSKPVKPKRAPRKDMNERCWRPYGPMQKLEYTSVNGEKRILEAPSRMRLCFAYRRGIGVSYVSVRDVKTHKPVIFDVTKKWVDGILEKFEARKVRAEASKKILNRAGLPPRKASKPNVHPDQAPLF